MVLKRRKDYDDASEESAWKLLSEVSLSEERFQEVKAYSSEAPEFQVEVDDRSMNQEEQGRDRGEEKKRKKTAHAGSDSPWGEEG